jgi:undecaprenyl diphosphate synthase
MEPSNTIPKHVAIIMDGNRRWAKAHGKSRLTGHDAGMKTIKRVVRHSSELGIEHLTIYAFSTENWKRSPDEVSGLFKLVVKYINRELDELNDNNVIVNVYGDYTALPKDAVAALERSFEKTADNTGLHFHIALNYGSRQEIVRAINSLVDAGESVTEESLNRHLYSGDVPDPDLIIRTSGEQRLSNFMLWQAAYSELVFTDVLWPDFDEAEYDRCLTIYASRKRRFGGK